jgi:thiol-disulfide isomerase/thioredoxin
MRPNPLLLCAAWSLAKVCCFGGGVAQAAGGPTLFYGRGKGGDLELITELDLDSHTAAKDGDEQWLVEFYAPWCPHCQHFKPVYGQVARQALDLNCKSSTIKVGAVNCVEQKDVCRNVEKITSFPTVKLFNGGGAAGAILKHREPSEVIQAVSERWHCSDGPVEDDGGADGGGDEDEGGAGADDGGDAQDGGGTAPDSQDQPVIGAMPLSPVMHDVGEAVWFTLKNTIFAGREVLNPREGLALTHFLGALQQLLPQEVPCKNSRLPAPSTRPLLRSPL